MIQCGNHATESPLFLSVPLFTPLPHPSQYPAPPPISSSFLPSSPLRSVQVLGKTVTDRNQFVTGVSVQALMLTDIQETMLAVVA